jgi:hypothetical protein
MRSYAQERLWAIRHSFTASRGGPTQCCRRYHISGAVGHFLAIGIGCLVTSWANAKLRQGAALGHQALVDSIWRWANSMLSAGGTTGHFLATGIAC